MKILLLDTETTGLESDPDAIVIEVGYAAWIEGVGLTNMVNALLYEPSVIDNGNPVEHINGITSETLETAGLPPLEVYNDLYASMDRADAVMAANYEFDKAMLTRSGGYHGITMPDVTWIDFHSDIEWPDFVKGKSLVHRAADHGIINPMAHRALPDAITMAMVIEKGEYNMHEILENAKFPMVRCEAAVSFAGKDKAKAQGFYWDNAARVWFKNVRENKLETLKKECGFELRF